MSGEAMSVRPVPLSAVAERLARDGLLITAPAADVAVCGVADDSRRVAAGDLFCAWAGTVVDSHSCLAEAERAGAVAALVERPVSGVTLPQVVVTDGRRAAAAAAMRVYGDPVGRLVLVGVTGTNGKTTTVWLLRHLLGARYEAASVGTLGVRVGGGAVVEDGENLTTPGPVALARSLERLVERGVRAVAMEASSHALHQGRVDSLRFDATVFTNVTRDHLDYHGTLEAYVAAKHRLADLLRPGGTAVVNAADSSWRGVELRAPRVLRYGVAPTEAEVQASGVVLGATGSRFRLDAPGGSATVELPFTGSFNVENALGAAATAFALGFEVGEVVERLATVPQVPGRLERVAERPCAVLTDYAHTPDALERVLSTLRPLVRGRLIVVFGAGGDRDRGKRPLMGAVAERWADLPIVTSDNPRTEDPLAIIADIEAGMRRPHLCEPDRRAAIALALERAGPEDLVLLAGKGHEDYQVLGTRKVRFDEREIVNEWLVANAPGASR
jgi:UDP-N-acetylmuramoyl-L-alanyl-D-glutamate--2,6-diaminopimelate ligase